MNDMTIPDPGLIWRASHERVRKLRIPFLFCTLIMGFAAVMAVSGASGLERAMGVFGLRQMDGGAAGLLAPDDLRRISAMSVEDKAQIVVEGLDAKERNAAIPLASLPLQKTGQFVIGSGHGHAYRTALKCLTQAVYYEAAFEPLQGRRAVAQVVLNRVRHPAYPGSICGVVYEGSHQRTGCQFSFTCDGALLRGPAAQPWLEAEAVARSALAGYVERSVGTATHYHADYVLPKWAFQLGKITQLGRHIFYRFNGVLGQSEAFTARYSGVERIPAIDYAGLRARVLEKGEAELAQTFVPGLTVPPLVTDRHDKKDVGGRLDMTKPWRLSIPDPVAASARYRQAVGGAAAGEKPKGELAMGFIALEPVQ
jgi:spore germination cell wall hydrolase CwlJ-like protein